MKKNTKQKKTKHLKQPKEESLTGFRLDEDAFVALGNGNAITVLGCDDKGEPFMGMEIRFIKTGKGKEVCGLFQTSALNFPDRANIVEVAPFVVRNG
jgi:hypothetical protein